MPAPWLHAYIQGKFYSDLKGGLGFQACKIQLEGLVCFPPSVGQFLFHHSDHLVCRVCRRSLRITHMQRENDPIINKVNRLFVMCRCVNTLHHPAYHYHIHCRSYGLKRSRLKPWPVLFPSLALFLSTWLLRKKPPVEKFYTFLLQQAFFCLQIHAPS